jgi:DNA-binding MarR family transcriptional regulator
VTTRYGQLLGEVGLTYPQYLVMLALWGAGPMTVTDLGKRLRLDSGTLSPLLKRLQRAGLVDRERDTADERRVLVQPTAAGWELRERVAHVPNAIGAAMGLDPQTYEDVKTRLAAILCSLELVAGPGD